MPDRSDTPRRQEAVEDLRDMQAGLLCRNSTPTTATSHCTLITPPQITGKRRSRRDDPRIFDHIDHEHICPPPRSIYPDRINPHL